MVFKNRIFYLFKIFYCLFSSLLTFTFIYYAINNILNIFFWYLLIFH